MRHCRDLLDIVLEAQSLLITYPCVTNGPNLVALNNMTHGFTVFGGLESWLGFLLRVPQAAVKVLAGLCPFWSSGSSSKLTLLLEEFNSLWL